MTDRLAEIRELAIAGKAWIRTVNDVAHDGVRVSPYPELTDLLEALAAADAKVKELEAKCESRGDVLSNTYNNVDILESKLAAASAAVAEYFKEDDFNNRSMYEAMEALRQALAPVGRDPQRTSPEVTGA